jgi:mannose-1-phosphate guanylyltransferase
MRHALIIAGGAGTRLWPMSRAGTPKQLIPFINGKSLLSLAWDRLEGCVDSGQRWVCAGETHRAAVHAGLPGLAADRFLGEPEGRDTLNALAYAAAVIARVDPDAVIGVFTADQLIEPAERFRQIVAEGYATAGQGLGMLVTFGITPTFPSTGYGYLRLGAEHRAAGRLPGADRGAPRVVSEFKEKPDLETATRWVAEGPAHFLWNSGMFVFSARGFLDCVRRYEPACHAAVARIAEAWGTAGFASRIVAEYTGLKKISVDFAVMEPASRDPAVTLVALPMDLTWMDIGSWRAFTETCTLDPAGNANAAERALLVDTNGTLVASSDPGHLIAVLGCDDLVIVHTPTATLVCRKDRAEDVKRLAALAAEQFGPEYR